MNLYKAYDIRGIYEKELTKTDAYMIGYYFIKLTNLKSVKIAHDKRLSYEPLTKYLIKGILDAKCNIEYLGISSTPNFYFSLFNGINSGIMITASHNPKEYNGFKFMLNGESFDSRNGLFEIEKLVKKDEDKIMKDYENISKQLENISLMQFLVDEKIDYKSTLNSYSNFLFEKYKKILTNEDIKILNNMNFSLDFSSGVSSLAVCDFLKKTNLSIKYFNDIVDGNFPIHSPDPQKAQDYLLQKKKKIGYFCGIFDGDGDRLMFYDENGKIILQDYIIASYIDFFSDTSKKFVCDLRVSKIINDMEKSKNLDIGLIRVGRAFYQDYMKKNNCEFGAELSGHLFFKEFNYLDNPDIAILFMLKIIAQNLKQNSKITFSQIFEKYKTYYKLEEKKYKVENTQKLFETLIKKYKFENIVSQIDGISFNLEDFWFNIRSSNTEPVVKVNIEAKTEDICLIELKKLEKIINKI